MVWKYNAVAWTTNEWYEGTPEGYVLSIDQLGPQLQKMKDNGINCLTILIPFAAYELNWVSDSNFYTKLERIFQEAQNRNMMVLFRGMGTGWSTGSIYPHDIEAYFANSGVLTWELWKTWWEFYAIRWNGKYPNVIFESISEPLNVEDYKFATMHQDLIDRIKAIDPARRISVSANGTDIGWGGAWHWDYGFEINYPVDTGHDGIMFSHDFYWNGEASVQDFDSRAHNEKGDIMLSMGKEVFFAEFAAMTNPNEAEPYTQACKTWMYTFLDWARTRGYAGAAHWRWTPTGWIERQTALLYQGWVNFTNVGADLVAYYLAHPVEETPTCPTGYHWDGAQCVLDKKYVFDHFEVDGVVHRENPLTLVVS